MSSRSLSAFEYSVGVCGLIEFMTVFLFPSIAPGFLVSLWFEYSVADFFLGWFLSRWSSQHNVGVLRSRIVH